MSPIDMPPMFPNTLRHDHEFMHRLPVVCHHKMIGRCQGVKVLTDDAILKSVP